MSFSFVDRITEFEPQRRARGTLTLPTSVPRFPTWLLAEATGQLAGWLAIASADFLRRPVAALTHRAIFAPTPPSGAEVELAVEIERIESDLVIYGGTAVAGGATVVGLDRCLGPMLAMEEFDDPRRVRERFECLRDGGEAGRDFRGGRDWELGYSITGAEYGERRAAMLVVPVDAPFFADHFPRKPVLPATLLLDALTRLAAELAAEAIPRGRSASIRPRVLRKAKMRAFVHPGDELAAGAQLMAVRESAAEILVYAKRAGKDVASARVELAIDQLTR
jgi:3-hydroxymyristoyl/3-hydroxydecanoyl-(acyl carrier protein) dehydratase